MATGKIKFIFSITKCAECPYKSDDGCYPGPAMVCMHPQVEKTCGDRLGRGVVYRPDCDIGFPPKCPLRLLPNANVEKVDIA